MSLETTAQGYSRGEITCAWVHERSAGGGEKHVLVYGVAELCPGNQPLSPKLGTSATGFQARASLMPNTNTLYMRRDYVTPEACISFFRGHAAAHVIPGVPPIGTAGTLLPFTSNEEPVLIEPNLMGGAGIGGVLPRRPTALSVLSKYDADNATGAWLAHPMLERAVAKVRETMGVDLARFPEQLGAVHLCFANPLLRRIERSVSHDDRTLFVRCYERAGKSVVGCEIELANEWPPVGNGFRLRSRVTAPAMAIAMPAKPQRLRLRLFDHDGRCIEDDSGVFIQRFGLRVGIAAKRRVTYVAADGKSEEVYHVETLSFDPVPARLKSPRTGVDRRLS